MKLNRSILLRTALLISVMANLTILSSKIQADTGSCGGVTITLPFTDVQGNFFFCQIAAAYFSGLTNGTTPTTYSPADNVTREQMAAFTTRTLDQSLNRGSRRAALNQWATPSSVPITGLTAVSNRPQRVATDGTDIWIADAESGVVSRVRAKDGRLLETWTSVTAASDILVARGRIYVLAALQPGRIYVIDPKNLPNQPPILAEGLLTSTSITTDGEFIWLSSGHSVTKVNPDTGAVTVSQPNFTHLTGILYDGSNIWVTDSFANTLLRLNSDGSIAQTVPVGSSPYYPIFDGTNIWVPNNLSDSITVIRAATGQVLGTLTGNGLDGPFNAAFDGQRILVTNRDGHSVSLWKAADLTPLGSFAAPPLSGPFGVCSDGINFWITLQETGQLARF